MIEKSGKKNPDIDNEDDTEDWWETGNEISVIPGLYVGSYMPAGTKEWLQAEKITHILTVSEFVNQYFPGEFVYKKIAVYDIAEADLLSHFSDTNAWIDEALKNGRVLVHCAAGVSRSVTITCAYLMYKMKITFEVALGIILHYRKCACPNEGFREQLIRYEEVILSE
eukprot:CAMPEP_0116999304 /NCGR_PEP_ID=MMETSP0472-20121206/2058_1 /TAXON_ID=693140 ORGANISM="Tiarina fusus, Strain LIS" /NCGR_SAMPLE_ID=MMETSP0472 /ASSEMBLY_ACC=CAM_ASM_000603 /LENGTH=167 /DNA_ID=CAMNT_0004698687 /DNA_START=254 /DNA_END=754 /DNA_ORIENTATION=+